MSQNLTDFSQLKRSMFKQETPKKEETKPEPLLENSEVSAELAYFERRLPGGLKRDAPSPSRDVERLATLEKELATHVSTLTKISEEKARLETAFTALEAELATTQAALKDTQEEMERWKAQCAHLQRTLQERLESEAPIAKSEEREATPQLESSANELLKEVTVDECFPGELREIVLSTLQEACQQAEQSGRERRAYLLQRLLDSNKPSGELDHRCEALRQILWCATSSNEIKAIETLGFTFVTNRNHWKYRYGNTQITLSKTPSDFRSNRNAVNEITNRCF